MAGGVPKPLVPLLEHVMASSREAGIERFVIVAGYRADLIRRWPNDRSTNDASVTLIENLEYQKANGVSALGAKTELNRPFLLLMSDHIFEAKTAQALLRQPLADDEVILAVDSKTDRVFDLDDATKVQRKVITSLELAKTFAATMRSTPGCSCAARRSSTGLKRQGKKESARCRTACAGWHKNGDLGLLILATVTGRTLTAPRLCLPKRGC